MLKVAAERFISVNNSRIEVEVKGEAWNQRKESKKEKSCYVTFRLLEHRDNSHILDLGLLRASSEYV